ncbi:MAG: hypothetical protein IJ532_03110 [Alphaproteobacteria bacterium]|nr:hypothetical protein [Alphaproteobacteria bacterium]
MVVAIAMAFTSCDKKAEVKKLGEYELIEKGDKLGLKLNGYTVLDPVYDEITENSDYSCVLAKKDKETTFVVGEHSVFTGEVIGITSAATAGYYVVATPKGLYLWKSGTAYSIGAFNSIAMSGEIVFFESDEGWGATFTDHTPIAPRRFEKVYVVRNKDTHAVLVYTKKNGWAMYDKGGVTDGVRYDTPSKVLEKQLKGFDTSKPYGVLDVNWNL